MSQQICQLFLGKEWSSMVVLFKFEAKKEWKKKEYFFYKYLKPAISVGTA